MAEPIFLSEQEAKRLGIEFTGDKSDLSKKIEELKKEIKDLKAEFKALKAELKSMNS